MLLRWIKESDGRHALELEDGPRRERVALETRSTLFHDLTHFALEEAAGLDCGFFGALAAGQGFAELAGPEAERGYSPAMLEVERAVAVLQQLAKRDLDPARLHERVVAGLAIQGAAPPEWFTAALVAAVRERLRQLLGRWRATPYGGAMELVWTRGPGRERAPGTTPGSP